jgi:hypothetical protein
MWKKCRLPLLLLALVAAPLHVSANDAGTPPCANGNCLAEVIVTDKSPETIDDIRCLAAGLRFAEMPDSHQKSTGMLMVLYYLGRLDGRNPDLDVEGLLSQEIPKMTAAEYAAEATRCSNNLSAKGQQISRLGEKMLPRFK